MAVNFNRALLEFDRLNLESGTPSEIPYESDAIEEHEQEEQDVVTREQLDAARKEYEQELDGLLPVPVPFLPGKRTYQSLESIQADLDNKTDQLAFLGNNLSADPSVLARLSRTSGYDAGDLNAHPEVLKGLVEQNQKADKWGLMRENSTWARNFLDSIKDLPAIDQIVVSEDKVLREMAEKIPSGWTDLGTGFISGAHTGYELSGIMIDKGKLLNEIMDRGEISEEDQQRLEQFDRAERILKDHLDSYATFSPGNWTGEAIQTLWPSVSTMYSGAAQSLVDYGIPTAIGAGLLLAGGAAATALTDGAAAPITAPVIQGTLQALKAEAFAGAAVEQWKFNSALIFDRMRQIEDDKGNGIPIELATQLSQFLAVPYTGLDFLGLKAVGTMLAPLSKAGFNFATMEMSPTAVEFLQNNPTIRSKVINAAEFFGVNILKEEMAEAGQQVIEDAGVNAGIAFSDLDADGVSLGEHAEAQWETLKGTVYAMSPLAALGAGARFARAQHAQDSLQGQVDDYNSHVREYYEHQRQMTETLTDVAQNSPTMQDNPELVRELVRNQVENGQLPSHMYISPQAVQQVFFQEDEEENGTEYDDEDYSAYELWLEERARREGIAAAMGITPESLQMSLATGADIVIPTEVGLQMLQDERIAQEISGNIRYESAAPEEIEFEQYMKLIESEADRQADFENNVVPLLEDAEREAQEAEIDDQLIQDLADPLAQQLRDSGYEASQADAISRLQAHIARRFGEALSVDPKELLDKIEVHAFDRDSDFRDVKEGRKTFEELMEEKMAEQYLDVFRKEHGFPKNASMKLIRRKMQPELAFAWGRLSRKSVKKWLSKDQYKEFIRMHGQDIFMKRRDSWSDRDIGSSFDQLALEFYSGTFKEHDSNQGWDFAEQLMMTDDEWWNKNKALYARLYDQEDELSPAENRAEQAEQVAPETVGRTENTETVQEQALYQKGKALRGAMGKMADGRYLVGIFSKANASTPIHEFSHMWLDVLRDMVVQMQEDGAKGPDWVENAWKTLHEVYGFEGNLTGETEAEEWRRVQERWARDFEAYAREGKAPTWSLQAEFNRFAMWLGKIYRSVKKLLGGEVLSEDMRNVFDHMIATQEDIDLSQRKVESENILESLEDVTEEQKTEYEKLLQKARERANARIANARIVERRQYEEELRKNLIDKRMFYALNPFYNAVDQLRRYDGGLSMESLKQYVSEETYEKLVKKWNIKGINPLFTKDGMSLEQFIDESMLEADVQGFISMLLDHDIEKVALQEEIDRGMQRWGEEHDAEAIYSGEYDAVLAAEIEALTGRKGLSPNELRDQMDKVTGVKRLSDLDASYKAMKEALRTEARGSREGYRAAKREFQEALRQQRETLKAQAEAKQAERDLKQALKEGKLQAEIQSLKEKFDAARQALADVQRLRRNDLQHARKEQEMQKRWDDAEKELALALQEAASEEQIQRLTNEVNEARRALIEERKRHKEELKHAEKEKEIQKRWDDAEKELAVAMKEGKMQEVINDLQAKADALKAELRQVRREKSYQHTWDMADLRRRLAEAAEKERLKRAALASLYRGKIETRNILNSIGRALKNTSIPYEYRLQVARIAANWGLGRPRVNLDAETLRGMPSLQEFLADKAADLFTGQSTVDVAQWLLPETFNLKHSKNELSLEQLRDIRNAINAIVKLGRDEKKILGEKAQKDLDAQAAECVASMNELSEAEFLPLEERRNLRQKIKGIIREGAVSLTDMVYLARVCDGYKQHGANYWAWVHPFRLAAEKEMQLVRQTEEKLEEVMAPLVEAAKDSRTFEIPGVKFKDLVNKRWNGLWDMEKVYCVALNMGNHGNLRALCKGYGWSMADVYQITSRLTEKEWNAIQDIWDTINTLKPEIAATYAAIKGEPMTEVDANPITVKTADGKTIKLRGGYYPLIFDQAFSDKAAELQAEDELLNRQLNAQLHPSVKKGFTIQREGGTMPPKLSLTVLHQHVQDTAHYATHAIPLQNAMKLFKQRDFKESFIKHLTEENYKNLVPWLRAIARPGGSPIVGRAAKAFDWLAQHGTMWALGMNFKTMLMQITSIGNSWDEIGLGHYLGACAKLTASPLDLPKMIWEKSAYMKQRSQMFDYTVAQRYNEMRLRGAVGVQVGRFRYALDKLQHAQFALISMMDSMVALPTWYGAYSKAIKQGVSEQDAVAIGDDAVSLAQGAGTAMDTSTMMQDGQKILRIVCPFMSFAMADANRKVYQTAGLLEYLRNDKSGINWRNWALGTAYQWFLPVMMSVAIVSIGRDNEIPEPEDFLWETLCFGSMGMPIIRDVFTQGREVFTGSSNGRTPLYLSGFSSISRGLYAGVRYAEKGKDEDLYRFFKGVTNAVGFSLGIGTGQIFRTIEGSTAYFVDDKGTILSPVLGKPIRHKGRDSVF